MVFRISVVAGSSEKSLKASLSSLVSSGSHSVHLGPVDLEEGSSKSSSQLETLASLGTSDTGAVDVAPPIFAR